MFPICVVLEKDRFGGGFLDKVEVSLEKSCGFVCKGIVCRRLTSAAVCVTVSCKSCAHCTSVGPEGCELCLFNV